MQSVSWMNAGSARGVLGFGTRPWPPLGAWVGDQNPKPLARSPSEQARCLRSRFIKLNRSSPVQGPFRKNPMNPPVVNRTDRRTGAPGFETPSDPVPKRHGLGNQNERRDHARLFSRASVKLRKYENRVSRPLGPKASPGPLGPWLSLVCIILKTSN